MTVCFTKSTGCRCSHMTTNALVWCNVYIQDKWTLDLFSKALEIYVIPCLVQSAAIIWSTHTGVTLVKMHGARPSSGSSTESYHPTPNPSPYAWCISTSQPTRKHLHWLVEPGLFADESRTPGHSMSTETKFHTYLINDAVRGSGQEMWQQNGFRPLEHWSCVNSSSPTCQEYMYPADDTWTVVRSTGRDSDWWRNVRRTTSHSRNSNFHLNQ